VRKNTSDSGDGTRGVVRPTSETVVGWLKARLVSSWDQDQFFKFGKHCILLLRVGEWYAGCSNAGTFNNRQTQTALMQCKPLISPPRKLRSKNPKVVLNLWHKLRKKLGKVALKFALKFRAIWLIFECKIILWSFDTLANFRNEQRNNVYHYYIGLMNCKS